MRGRNALGCFITTRRGAANTRTCERRAPPLGQGARSAMGAAVFGDAQQPPVFPRLLSNGRQLLAALREGRYAKSSSPAELVTFTARFIGFRYSSQVVGKERKPELKNEKGKTIFVARTKT